MTYGVLNVDTVQSSTAATAPVFKDGNGTQIGTLCRCWVNFGYVASAITIRNSFNVSSVTRSGTGTYVVNFTNAMPDANYSYVSLSGSPGVTNGFTIMSGPSASAVNLTTVNTSFAAVDCTYVTAAVFR